MRIDGERASGEYDVVGGAPVGLGATAKAIEQIDEAIALAAGRAGGFGAVLDGAQELLGIDTRERLAAALLVLSCLPWLFWTRRGARIHTPLAHTSGATHRQI